MLRVLLISAIAVFPAVALAESVVAKRTIRANAVVTSNDLAISDITVPGALSDMADAIGMEARLMIYAGRPLLSSDLGPPAVIERNEVVKLRFRKNGLVIETEGRSMARGALGETIRAVNLSSRISVSGKVMADGSIQVIGSSGTQE